MTFLYTIYSTIFSFIITAYDMRRAWEQKLNNRIIDFVIGGSYLGDSRTKFFTHLKKLGLEAYAHILDQYNKFTQWYRE